MSRWLFLLLRSKSEKMPPFPVPSGAGMCLRPPAVWGTLGVWDIMLVTAVEAPCIGENAVLCSGVLRTLNCELLLEREVLSFVFDTRFRGCMVCPKRCGDSLSEVCDPLCDLCRNQFVVVSAFTLTDCPRAWDLYGNALVGEPFLYPMTRGCEPELDLSVELLGLNDLCSFFTPRPWRIAIGILKYGCNESTVGLELNGLRTSMGETGELFFEFECIACKTSDIETWVYGELGIELPFIDEECEEVPVPTIPHGVVIFEVGDTVLNMDVIAPGWGSSIVNGENFRFVFEKTGAL